MNYLCTKCNINWAALTTCEFGEDQIEVCPICLSDHNLVEGTDTTSYIKCPVSGKITDVSTKEELIIPLPLPAYYRPFRERPAMTDTAASIEERDNRALDAYFKSGNREDFFRVFNQQL